MLVLVAVIADGIGEADQIEPTDGHALAIMRRGEQAIDLLFVGVWVFIGDEGFILA